MRGTVAIITCDHEDGCDDWTVDYWEIGVLDWRELMPGWTYDPWRYAEDALCPAHAPKPPAPTADELRERSSSQAGLASFVHLRSEPGATTPGA